MNKLQEIISLCKCGVHIEINNHRNLYETAEEVIFESFGEPYNIGLPHDPEAINIMIETDTIIEIQCYQDTPVGSWSMCHYDIDILLDQMLEVLRKNK